MVLRTLRALDYTIYLAKKICAGITTMHVIENPPTVLYMSSHIT
jgi:hypothetical protein